MDDIYVSTGLFEAGFHGRACERSMKSRRVLFLGKAIADKGLIALHICIERST